MAKHYTDADLAAKVKGENEVNKIAAKAWRLYSNQVATLPDGYKVKLAGGGFTKAFKVAMPENQRDGGNTVTLTATDYSLHVDVKVCVQVEGTHHCLYCEKRVYLANLSGQSLVKFNADELARNRVVDRLDFTVEGVRAKLQAIKDAEEALREATSAAYPFA